MTLSAIDDHRSLSEGLDRTDIHGTYVLVEVILYRDNGGSGPRSGSDSKVDKLLHLAHLPFDQPVG